MFYGQFTRHKLQYQPRLQLLEHSKQPEAVSVCTIVRCAFCC